jgi:Kelch motif
MRHSNASLAATATAMIDGHVLVVGGNDGTDDLSSAEIFDSATGAFFTTGAMQIARSGHVAVLLPNNNQVLFAGGMSAGAAVASAELYADWRDGFPNNSNTANISVSAPGYATQMQSLTFNNNQTRTIDWTPETRYPRSLRR